MQAAQPGLIVRAFASLGHYLGLHHFWPRAAGEASEAAGPALATAGAPTEAGASRASGSSGGARVGKKRRSDLLVGACPHVPQQDSSHQRCRSALHAVAAPQSSMGTSQEVSVLRLLRMCPQTQRGVVGLQRGRGFHRHSAFTHSGVKTGQGASDALHRQIVNPVRNG